ncbi:MAG: hydrogenase 3 maturation endopeptidase HyCI [Candidatus Omnitrophota bacterium]
MQTIKSLLKDRLTGAKRIAVLGVGSDLRADDEAGLLVAKGLLKNSPSRKGRVPIAAFIGATAPENLTGEIKRFKPSHLLIIDSAEFGNKPGTILVLKPADIKEGVTFSTHLMPARILSEYFHTSMKCDITIIGIQPGTMKFGKPVSKSVKSAAKEVIAAILSAAKR